MTFEDLSEYGDNEYLNALCVGWLDPRDDSFSKGETKKEIIDRIRYFNENPVWLSAGQHVCEYCEENGEDLDEESFSSNLLIIPDEKLQQVYFMPEGVIHYIIKHNYKLPSIVEDAILNVELDHKICYGKANKILQFHSKYEDYLSTTSYKTMTFKEFLKTKDI